MKNRYTVSWQWDYDPLCMFGVFETEAEARAALNQYIEDIQDNKTIDDVRWEYPENLYWGEVARGTIDANCTWAKVYIHDVQTLAEEPPGEEDDE